MTFSKVQHDGFPYNFFAGISLVLFNVFAIQWRARYNRKKVLLEARLSETAKKAGYQKKYLEATIVVEVKILFFFLLDFFDSIYHPTMLQKIRR